MAFIRPRLSSYPVLPSRTSPALSFGKGALRAPGAKAAASSAKLRLAPLRVRCGSISNCPKNKENVHLHHLGIKILVPQKKSGSGDSFDVEQDVQKYKDWEKGLPIKSSTVMQRRKAALD